MYVVIMAGGGGTRLHPLSTPERPKPFLPLLGEETLLQRTVARVRPLVGRDDLFCVTDRRYEPLVHDQVPEVHVLAEPEGRNTAAAIALAAAAIDRAGHEVMLVLPADHWIEREASFRAAVQVAAGRLAPGALGVEAPLVTLGVQPDHPSTDYGYLRPDGPRGAVVDGLRAYPLLGFEEKPTAERAGRLLAEPGVAWNAGMFAWRRDAIRGALAAYAPLPASLADAWPSEERLAAAYSSLPSTPIDRAVMEPAAAEGRVLMVAMDAGWSDVGSWTALLAGLAGHRAGAARGRVVRAGEAIEVGDDDLVVRPGGRGLVVDAPGRGTIVADAVWAHLTDARHLGRDVDALLDRAQGSRA